MLNRILQWVRRYYHTVVGSIAFYPMLIVVLFAAGGWGLFIVDRSAWGIALKAATPWLGLQDASAARIIVSTIAAGILSLTVFSFSMVMVVLSQAAAQLSNRTLDQLIGNRFQQVVLGFYIGTIVYALLLLTTIRERDQGVSIPALSIYVLILLTITDIFLFIYFLHFITRTVKYEVVIDRIHADTRAALEEVCTLQAPDLIAVHEALPFVVEAERSGVYEGVHAPSLVRFCTQHDVVVELTELPGSFILRGGPLLRTDRPLVGKELDELRTHVTLAKNGSVEGHHSFGFRQLTEVAMKALSPGLNDPGTALLALRSLFQLFVFRLEHHPVQHFADDEGKVRVILREWPFQLLFTSTVLAIWDYGKHDRSIRHELRYLLPQLSIDTPEVRRMLELVEEADPKHKD